MREMNLSQTLLILALVSASGFLLLGVISCFRKRLPTSKLLQTASSLTGLASILQLKISGWFGSVMAHYGDVNKFPFGPPGEIARQIIDDPDSPIQAAIWNTVFFDAETGARLGLVSILIGIWATWA